MLRSLPLVTLLLLVAGCDSLSQSGDATFTGTVLDAATSAPVEGATVRVQGTAGSTVTGAAGTFSVTVAADSSDQPVTIVVTAPGYAPATVTAQADVGGPVEVPLVMLAAAGGPGGGSSAPSGPGTSITLDARAPLTVGVRGAGADETATLTFLVLDGQGRAVDSAHAADLSFSIANGPGGGELLDPLTATTDSTGRARTTLTSGDRAGTVQVLATATVGGRTLRSLPVTVTITGGLPDGAHFSVAPAQVNVPGYDRLGLTDAVTAYVGDLYGNPVQPGTSVYFTTDGGLIEGSGVTGPLGQSTVTLVTAAPLPSNAVSCPGGTAPQGYAVVTARTSDLNQATISSSATVLFSGQTTLGIVSPGGLEVGPYSFTVSDRFGHPLALGTTIAVTADGVNVRTIGDTSFEVGDHLCPGPGRTEFRFVVAAAATGGEAPPPVVETVTITVTSPNGDARLTRTATGGGRPRDHFERLD